MSPFSRKKVYGDEDCGKRSHPLHTRSMMMSHAAKPQLYLAAIFLGIFAMVVLSGASPVTKGEHRILDYKDARQDHASRQAVLNEKAQEGWTVAQNQNTLYQSKYYGAWR